MKALIPQIKHAVILAVISALGLSALADQTWNGSVNNQWNVAGNWSGAALPGANDAAIFNNLSTLNLSGVLGQAFTVQSVMVSNVPAAVSISDPSSSILTLTPTTLYYTNVVGSTTNRLLLGIGMPSATQSLAISVPVALGTSTQAWVVASGQTLDVSGPVSGASAAIYKDGLGALTLEGTNSFTGTFIDNGGAVWINNSLGLGGGGTTRNIWIANNALGAGLHLNGTNGSIVLPTILQFNLSQQYGAIINEAGSNVVSGNVYVQSGGGLAYVLANAGTLVFNGPIGLSVASRPFQVGGAGNGIMNGAIGSTLSFIKTDSGTWTLTNHNAYSGATTIQGGTLVLSTNATIANTPSITLLSNAVLDVSAVFNTSYNSNALYLTPGSTIQALAGNGGVIGNVQANSTAYLVPGGTNGIGTLSFSNNLSLANMTSAFELNTSTTPGGGVNDLVNVGGDLDPGYSAIFVTALSALTSPGTYRLFNYSGAELNSFSTVSLQTDTRYTFGIDDLTTTNQVNLTVASSAATTVNVAGTVRPYAVLFTNDLANYTLSGSGKITGATGLTKGGSGALLITAGNNDFTGPVTVTNGTLEVSTFNPVGSASPLGAGNTIVLNGGTFQFNGAKPAASAVNRYWTLGANGGTILSTNGAFFLANQISGPGSLTKTGSVQIILGDINNNVASPGASNSYSGNTYITQGELQIRNSHAVGTGKVVVSYGADLAFGGGVNYGSLTNDIDLNGGDGNGGAGTLEVNNTDTVADYSGTINLLTNSSVGCFNLPASFSISGRIIGPGSLTKQNHVTCTVILTCPTNSYSGGTLVAGGTLQLGNGGACGGLGSGAVTNNGTLAYNHSD